MVLAAVPVHAGAEHDEEAGVGVQVERVLLARRPAGVDMEVLELLGAVAGAHVPEAPPGGVRVVNAAHAAHHRHGAQQRRGRRRRVTGALATDATTHAHVLAEAEGRIQRAEQRVAGAIHEHAERLDGGGAGGAIAKGLAPARRAAATRGVERLAQRAVRKPHVLRRREAMPSARGRGLRGGGEGRPLRITEPRHARHGHEAVPRERRAQPLQHVTRQRRQLRVGKRRHRRHAGGAGGGRQQQQRQQRHPSHGRSGGYGFQKSKKREGGGAGAQAPPAGPLAVGTP
mmetsp:Transcript_23873/g.75177  ORF Transcript_23873/g.75177 Transcript_23873/m.75177 type:complete len:286 (+) Transcript_23873:4078-4935(+)